jgi:VanZ family protein
MGQRTLARPLAWLLTALIVYASLYPFEGWRIQGGNPLAFVTAPLPRYWTAFDVVANLLGYVPLGFLTVLIAVRHGLTRASLLWAVVSPCLLSLVMETTQAFLPSRVSSNVDWAMNTLGGALGAGLALWLAGSGWLLVWQRWRMHWFEPDAHGALVLLALWPVALLYPASLPFGLGQVWRAVESGVAQWLDGTPWSHWLPVRSFEGLPLNPLTEAWCMALGLLAPCLLGYSVLRGWVRRMQWLLFVLAVSVLVSGLSSALTYDPTHAWIWLTPPVVLALCLCLVLGGLGTVLSRRAAVVWLVWVVLAALTLINSAPVTPYLAESLNVWAQGRFIRFHGLTQWLGWLWPYAVMLHAAIQISWRHRARSIDTEAQLSR